MIKAKTIITTLIAACAISATASTSASASWMVGGTTLSGSAPLATTARVVENFKAGISGVDVECTGSTYNGVEPQIESESSDSAKSLEFTGCSAVSPCELGGQNKGGEIGTLPVIGAVTLGSGVTSAIKLKPKSGTLFATVAFTGASCPLSGKQSVTGEILAEDPTGQTEKKLQDFRAVTTQASGLLKVGGSAASLEGEAEAQLASGGEWSFL